MFADSSEYDSDYDSNTEEEEEDVTTVETEMKRNRFAYEER